MRGQPFRFTDFHGGVNTNAAPYLLKDNQCRDARNIVSSVHGSIRKRDGCQNFSTPATEITSLFAAEATATPFLVGVTTGNDLVKIASTGTATSIKGALTITAANPWCFCSAPAQTQGPVFGVNRTNTPIAWLGTGNATTWTASVVDATHIAVPNGKFVVAHDNRVWIANTSGGSSSLYFSALGDPRTWPIENVVQLDPSDGDEITGLGKVGSYLLVFKRRKVFAVHDTSTGANARISDTVGTCAHRSIAESPFGTFFLTQDRGVYRTNGSTVEPVSHDIDSTLEDVAPGERDDAAGIFFDDHYYLSVADDLTCDYDATLQSWWLHSFAANQWVTWRPSSTQEIYAANRGVAKVSKAFVAGVTQDNAANFTAYWKGPWLAFGAPYLRKRVRQAHVDGVGPIDFYIARDFNAGSDLAASSLLDTSTTTFGGSDTFGGGGLFGDSDNTQEARVFTLGVARAWSAIFQASTNTAMEIDSYTLAVTSRKN